MQAFNSLNTFFREAVPGDWFRIDQLTRQECLTVLSREDYSGERFSLLLACTYLAFQERERRAVGTHKKVRILFARDQDSSNVLCLEWHPLLDTRFDLLRQDADGLQKDEALNAHVEHFGSLVSSREEEFKVGDIVGHGLTEDGGPGLLAKIESIDGDVITLDNGDEFVLDDQGVAVSTGNAGRDRLYALEPDSMEVAKSAVGSIGFFSYQIKHFARPEYIESSADLVREYQEKIDRAADLFEEYAYRS